MRKIKARKVLAAVAVAVMVLVYPVSSQAFKIMQTEDGSAYIYGLRDPSITFESWSGFTQETRWAIDYAARQWNNRTGKTKLFHSVTQHNEANKYAEKDGRNLITKVPTIASQDGKTTLMRTSCNSTWNGSKYKLVEVDIMVNGSVPWRNNGSANGYDVQNAMTHEFGHMLGLGHSDVAWATMAEGSDPGELWKRTIEQDDINGFNFLYS